MKKLENDPLINRFLEGMGLDCAIVIGMSKKDTLHIMRLKVKDNLKASGMIAIASHYFTGKCQPSPREEVEKVKK